MKVHWFSVGGCKLVHCGWLKENFAQPRPGLSKEAHCVSHLCPSWQRLVETLDTKARNSRCMGACLKSLASREESRRKMSAELGRVLLFMFFSFYLLCLSAFPSFSELFLAVGRISSDLSL